MAESDYSGFVSKFSNFAQVGMDSAKEANLSRDAGLYLADLLQRSINRDFYEGHSSSDMQQFILSVDDMPKLSLTGHLRLEKIHQSAMRLFVLNSVLRLAQCHRSYNDGKPNLRYYLGWGNMLYKECATSNVPMVYSSITLNPGVRIDMRSVFAELSNHYVRTSSAVWSHMIGTSLGPKTIDDSAALYFNDEKHVQMPKLKKKFMGIDPVFGTNTLEEMLEDDGEDPMLPDPDHWMKDL